MAYNPSLPISDTNPMPTTSTGGTLPTGGATAALQTALNALQTVSISTPPQVVATSGTSAQSAAVNATTTRVFLTCTQDCWVSIGSNPTASAAAGSFFIAAGSPFYPISVTGGSSKIAVIQDSAAGKLSIVESA